VPLAATGLNIGALSVAEGVGLERLTREGICSLGFVDTFVNHFTDRQWKQ
jgi:hypothetical protein